jgi:hypothetical protein
MIVCSTQLKGGPKDRSKYKECDSDSECDSDNKCDSDNECDSDTKHETQRNNACGTKDGATRIIA